MVWLLDKQFAFYTDCSIEDCLASLDTVATTGGKLTAFGSIVLIKSNSKNGIVTVKLKRDLAKGIYAEVVGDLEEVREGVTKISGRGRVPIFHFLLYAYFSVIMILVIVNFSETPEIVLISLVGIIISLVFVLLCFNNRNRLINLMYITLKT